MTVIGRDEDTGGALPGPGRAPFPPDRRFTRGRRRRPVPSCAPWSPSGCSRCSTTPRPWPSASRRPATACTSSAGACATPSSAHSSRRGRPRLHHRRPARRHRGGRAGLGRRGVGPGQALRHDRRQEGRPHLRDHHPPGRGVHARLPQARGRVRRRRRGRPLPPRLHRQRHGARARHRPSTPSSSIPSAALADLAAHRLRTPAVAGRVVHRRPAAHAAGRPVHRRLRPRPRPRPGRRRAPAARPARDRVRRAHPRRARQAAGRRRAGRRACGSSSTPAWPTSSCPSCRRCALEQDPIHRHKDVLAHTIAVVEKTSPDKILRLAALFHDIGKPKTRSIGPGGVSFHHHEVVGARMAASGMRALRYPNDEIADVSRLVELHLRFHGYGDAGGPTAPCAATSATPGPLLDEAQRADPLRLHHPQPAQGRRAGPAHGRARGAHRRAAGAGGARRASGPTSTATR